MREKKLLFVIGILFIFLFCPNTLLAQGVAINPDGSVAHESAMLDVKSTDKGFLVPRMTQTQRNAIATPTTGLMIYQTDNTPGFYYYNGSAWNRLGTGNIESLTFNAPLSSTGGATPSISIALANSSTNGYINSTDWNTFNNKLGTSLLSARIFVGNASNIATGVTMSGDASLSNSGLLTVTRLQGRSVSNSAPSNGQVLEWNGSAWTPGNDDNTSYSAGTGLTLTGTVFTPTFGTSVGTVSEGNHGHTNMISGTGTTNYVSKFTATNTLGNSQIFDNGTYVGIGTTNPQSQLHITEDMQIGTDAVNRNNILTFWVENGYESNLIMRETPDHGLGIRYNATDNKLYIDRYASSTIPSPIVTILRDSESIGIGTSAPSAQLHTTGTVRFQNYTSGTLQVDGSGNLSVGTGNSLFTAGNGLSWSGTTLNSVWTASGTNIYNNNSANVGIGIALPTQKLEVAGTTKANHFYTGYNWTSKTNGINLGVDGISGGIGFYDGSTSYSASIFREATTSNFYVGVRSGQILNGITINSTGNVGIARTDPAQKLDVVGRIRSSDPSYSTSRWIDIYSTSAQVIETTNDLYIGTTNASAIHLQPGRVGSSNSFVHIRDNSGTNWASFDGTNQRLGIGTNTPAAQLHTTGSVRFANLSGTGNRLVLADSEGDLLTKNASSFGECHTLPNTAGTAQWVKLGTLTISQQGKSAFFHVVTNAGYNASSAQNSDIYIRFKTSNGSSFDANGFAGDGTYYTEGKNNQFLTNNQIKFVANAAGGSATSFDVYILFNPYTGVGSFYEILTTEGTWTHSGTTASDPGIASSTIMIPTQEFNIGAGSLVVDADGEVGIGTTTPTSKLHVNSGSVRISGSTNTNAETGGKLIYSNASGLGGGTAQKVERYSKLIMTSGSSYEIYDDYAVTLYAYRSSDYYYIKLAPKSGHAGWWDYSEESAGDDIDCSTAGTQYTMSSNWGVNYGGGFEIVINRETNNTTPTYRIRPHLHSSIDNGYASIIVEAYYP